MDVFWDTVYIQLCNRQNVLKCLRNIVPTDTPATVESYCRVTHNSTETRQTRVTCGKYKYQLYDKNSNKDQSVEF